MVIGLSVFFSVFVLVVSPVIIAMVVFCYVYHKRRRAAALAADQSGTVDTPATSAATVVANTPMVGGDMPTVSA